VRKVTPILCLGLAALAAPASAQQQSNKVTVAVAPFTFHTNVAAPPGTALETSQLTNKFVTALVNTHKFDVVERERVDQLIGEMQMSESGLMDPARAAQAGHTLGADYFLMGEISVFTLTTTVRQVPNTSRWNRQEDLRLILDMRIVDTRTSRIVAAEKGESAMHGSQMFRERPSVDAPVDPKSLDDIQRDVIEKVVLKVVDAIYPVRIIAVNQDGVAVNRGEGGGLSVGDTLDTYAEGEQMVDPDTGEVLGSEETKTGRVRITQVLAKFSKGQVLAGAPAVGQICRPASGDAPAAAPPPPPPPRDTTPPQLTVLAPKEGATLNQNPINIVVQATDDSGQVARVAIAGRDATRDDRGNWRGQVRANEGGNRVRIEAWDAAGNHGEASVTFAFDSTPPTVQADARLLVEGTVDDLGCTLTINGQPVQYDKKTGRYSARVTPDAQNPGVVTIVVTDEYGNQRVESRRVQ
jgi:TolB-like protein